MHHSVLWPLIDYQTDMIEESDNLILENEGQYVEETSTYSTTETLQNDNVDSSRKFIWYEYKVSKVNCASNCNITAQIIKMNDQTRYGCMALDYLTIFGLRDTINVVNHMYCKYLTKHPTDPQLSIFHDNKCITVKKDQLRDNNIIVSNCISCCNSELNLFMQYLSGDICQRLIFDILECLIHGNTEYDCVQFDQKEQIQILESDYCFLNIQKCNKIL